MWTLMRWHWRKGWIDLGRLATASGAQMINRGHVSVALSRLLNWFSETTVAGFEAVMEIKRRFNASRIMLSIGVGVAFSTFNISSLAAQDKALKYSDADNVEMKPLSEDILRHLPSDYRVEAAKLIQTTEYYQKDWLRQGDQWMAVNIVLQLSKDAEGQVFLLAQLEKESSPELRSRIIDDMLDYWKSHRETEGILERHATSDPDADVAIRALDTLQKIRMNALDQLLESRVLLARSKGDSNTILRLAPEQERWLLLKDAIMLPEFLRTPPPVFSVVVNDLPIRVLAFGDFGGETAIKRKEQADVAAAMVQYHKKHPFDFGLTLGDNFYDNGLSTPTDARWQSQWEQLYGPMGIKFYPTLGNHDWYSQNSPAAEIVYSYFSPDWRFPAIYYTFTAGSVQFFAIDTEKISEAELLWLDLELSKSKSRWKVVYGHHPIYSAGSHGGKEELVERLLPILKNRVDVYLSGHDHNLQELKEEAGVHFFVSGGGGAGLYPITLPEYEHSVFKSSTYGFSVIEADANHLRVSFIGTDGGELHESTLTK